MKKEIIADMFRKHFNVFGFNKTSVDDVAQELKISKKTIYQFFNTKEEIYYWILKKVAKQYCQKFEKQMASFDTNHDKLDFLIRVIFSESRKWMSKNDVLEFKYKYQISELAFQEAFNDLIRTLIEKGAESREFRSDNPEMALSFIKGIISESMKILHENPKANIETETVKAIFRILKK